MNFKQRKKIEQEVVNYINSEYTCIEHLIGLKVIVQALDVAIDRRLKYMINQRDKLNSKVKLDNEEDWLD